MNSLEAHLRSLRDGRRKILAPYLTAGFPSPAEFPDLVKAVAAAGADMLEIGVPFSDPIIDGPVIQEASRRALAAEVRPPAAVRMMASIDPGIPFVLMTYVNPVVQMGWHVFAREAVDCGASGVIVPDLPIDEASDWLEATRAQGLSAVFLVAPTTPRERLEQAATLGSGFVYCVSLLGVTGVRQSLSARAQPLVDRVRSVTSRPALVGLGVSSPGQAAEACAFSDGVIVGSAVIKAIIDSGVDAAARLVADMRTALDGAS